MAANAARKCPPAQSRIIDFAFSGFSVSPQASLTFGIEMPARWDTRSAPNRTPGAAFDGLSKAAKLKGEMTKVGRSPLLGKR